MKKLFSNRKVLFAAILLMLIIALILLWLRFGEKKTIDAEVTSSGGSHYALVLPSGSEPADFVNYDSSKYQPSFQFQHHLKDIHVMVIDESKAKIISFGLDYDLETYMKIASRQLDSAGLYVNKPMSINSNKALQTEIRGMLKGKKQVYVLTAVETPKFFYQVLVWTAADRYDANKADISMINNSFREIDTKETAKNDTRPNEVK